MALPKVGEDGDLAASAYATLKTADEAALLLTATLLLTVTTQLSLYHREAKPWGQHQGEIVFFTEFSVTGEETAE